MAWQLQDSCIGTCALAVTHVAAAVADRFTSDAYESDLVACKVVLISLVAALLASKTHKAAQCFDHVDLH